MKFLNILGAIVGDICGSRFEFNNYKGKDFLIPQKKEDQKLGYHYTDDTVLTIAVCDILLTESLTEGKIIERIKYYGNKYNVAYGNLFDKWLHNKNPKPYNSYGNGSAMRISPVAFYAKSEAEVKDLTMKITKITHNHEEGIKGALVVAMCIYYAKCGYTKAFIKEFASKYYELNFNYLDLVKNYSFDSSCMNSIPQAIYCFLISNSFLDTIRTAISIGGDSDTIASIGGAIASAYYDVNQDFISKNIYNNFLPNEFKKTLIQFYKKIRRGYFGQNTKSNRESKFKY